MIIRDMGDQDSVDLFGKRTVFLKRTQSCFDMRNRNPLMERGNSGCHHRRRITLYEDKVWLDLRVKPAES